MIEMLTCAVVLEQFINRSAARHSPADNEDILDVIELADGTLDPLRSLRVRHDELGPHLTHPFLDIL